MILTSYEVKDLNFYLQNTIILVNNMPFLVDKFYNNSEPSGVILKLNGRFHPFSPGCATSVIVSQVSINVKNLPTGYVNYEDKSIYIIRMPCRRFKQGLASENLFFDYNEEEENSGNLWGTVIKSPGFISMICNAYPSFSEVSKMMSGYKELAFAKDFSLKKGQLNLVYLQYKNKSIAYEKDGDFITSPKFAYLSEICETQGIKLKVKNA